MIIGCYTVNLYCEMAEENKTVCNVGWGYNGPPTYTGETEGECLRAARMDGWLFTRKPRKAYCPECAARRRKGHTLTPSTPEPPPAALPVPRA